MHKIVFSLIAATFLLFTSFGEPVMAESKLADGMYAKFVTDKGDIVCTLEFEKTPITVANFVGLAEGTKQLGGGAGKESVRFYDGLKFHRVIDNFMIQGGCPLGTGTGGPGYTFPDEIDPTLRHSGPGILAIYISFNNIHTHKISHTHTATPHLDGKHTVFGHVVSGQDVVNAIAKDDTIKTIEIIRVGDAAKAFQSDQAAFDALLGSMEERAKEKELAAMEEAMEQIKGQWPDAVTTPSGLKYVVVAEGTGETPAPGSMVKVHYTGKLLDGTKFDSSVERGTPIDFPVGQGRVIKGWDEALLTMKKGEKRVLIIPANLGYGPSGRGPIPPNATMVFDVELIDF